MKKVFSLLITLAMLISTAVVPMSVSADASKWDGTTDTEWAGEGTKASPYLITSAAELAGLASNVNGGTDYAEKYFKITNDIDLTNTANADWTPIGTRGNDDTGMCAFNGIIDGAGHVISNVKMTSPKNAMGLFGAIGSKGKVSKLGLNGVDIQFANVSDTSIRCYQAGGFVAYLAGSVEKCYAKNVTIKNTANDTSEAANGGFVGRSKGALTDCYSYNVTLAGSKSCTRGGFVSTAENYVQNATNCYSANVAQEKLNATDTFIMYGFGRERVVNTNVGKFASNCYTTSANDPRDDYAMVTTTTKENLIAGIVTDGSSYVLNNNVKSINDGYPVLAWEDKNVWDGTAVADWAGEGTAEKPYLISTAAELAGLASKVYNATAADVTATEPTAPVAATNVSTMFNAYTGTYFKLTADIDLANEPWTPIGRIGMRFNGVFDGDGHVVKNMRIGTAGTFVAQGLFGAINDDTHIYDLGLENATIVFDNGGTPNDYKAAAVGVDVSWNAGDSRTIASGGLVGLYGASEIENCYVKNVNINNTNTARQAYEVGGFMGGGWSTNDTANTQKITCNNCYVTDVTIAGNFNEYKGLFVGSNSHPSHQDDKRLLYYFDGCYVGGTVTAGSAVYEFANQWGLNGSGMMTDCYTTATGYATMNFSFDCYVVTNTDKVGVEKALVTGNNTWNLDSVKNPINGGYPVLGWEKYWTVDTDPMAFYKVTDYADGKVTLIQSDNTVTGTVIVAVYDGTRFVNAVTATAANGEITVSGLTAEPGNTIKVFVWNSLDGVRPLGVEYSTTIAEATE